MLRRKLIIIAPKAPPAICGVSDYAFQLGIEMRKIYEVVEIGIQVESEHSDFNHWKKSLKIANSDSEGCDLILNYTPASYARSGLAISLTQSLKKFKRSNSDNRIFVIFHETWNGNDKLKLHHRIRDKFSKWSATQIGRLSAGIAVVTKEQKKKIESVVENLSIIILPVGANITPENVDSGLKSNRKEGVWVVFGLPHTRLWTIKAFAPAIKHLINNGVIKEIRSIGPKNDRYATEENTFAGQHFGNGVLNQIGPLSVIETTNELLQAYAAFVNQTSDSINKSGTFAAMAAHAVPVFANLTEEYRSQLPGSAVFTIESIINNPILLSSEEAYEKRRQLHGWFWSSRSWPVIGKTIEEWINKSE